MRKNTIRTIHNSVDPSAIIEVNLYYDEGGCSYATYESKERGYYLSAMPLTIGQHGGFTTRQFSAYSGYYSFIKPAKRFSSATLSSLTVDQTVLGRINGLVKAVIERNQLNPEEYAIKP